MMVSLARLAALAVLLSGFQALVAPQPPAPGDEDPRIRSVVERFFAAQEAEDAAAYLALWSAQAQKPRPEQLAFVFKSGDDRFTDIAIRRVVRIGDLHRVIVSVARERTSSTPGPGGKPMVSNTVREWSLTLVPEGDALKILSEGFPADDLATALIAAPTPEARAALMDAEPQALNSRLLSAITSRADSLVQARRLAAARDIYERVLEVARRIGNRQVEGEALQSIGNSYYFENDHPSALEFYERRLALERGEANDAGVAGALLGIATIKYSSFEYGDALTAYQEALVLYERLDDQGGMATALLSSGNVRYLQGEFEGAASDYTRSRDLYKASLDTDGEARALGGLGRVHMAQGDYAGALVAFAGVKQEGRARGNRIMQANALHSTGEVHLRLGNANAARAAFEESRGHFEAAADPASTGVSWQGTALAELLAARFEPAEQAYGHSMKSCAAAPDRECVARAILGLAFAQFSQEHYGEAIASYRKAIEAFEALTKKEEIGRAEVGLSQALFGRRDFAAAAAAAASARGRTPAYDVLWRAHLAEARARRALKAGEAAMSAAQAAVDVVDAMARAALDQPSKRMSADSASAFTFLAVLEAEAGTPSAAFETVERGHAHALHVALAANERDIVRRMSAEAREAEREAAARVGSLQAQIDKEEGLPKPNAQRIAQLRQALESAAARRTLQREEMFDRWPELRTWRGLAPPVTAAEVEAFVAADGAPVVQLLIDQDDLLAVTAAPGAGGGVRFAASVSATSRRTLGELVAAAVARESLEDANEWRTRSAPLAAAIPADARALLTTSKRATLIVDDFLWRVPFEALPIEEAYLASSVELTYAMSVTALVRAREADRPAAAGQGVALAPAVGAAAPALSEERLALVSATSPDWRLRDAEVASREAMAFGGRFDDPPTVSRTGAEATEGALRAGLAGARLAHIGAPFRVSSASPMFSSILLAEPPPPPAPEAGAPVVVRIDPADDGVLEGREVANLDVSADVVVLSDGTALSMRDAAGALPTVRWLWRAAGAGTIVFRRWTDDHASADAMLGDFHARVRAGEVPLDALAAARRTLRADPPQAPWYWASWIVFR